MGAAGPYIVLRRGRDGAVRHGHPWVFSGAIARWSQAGATACTVVDVLSDAGEWLGRGVAQPDASLAVRLYTRRPDEAVDDALFARLVREAADLRRALFRTVEDPRLTDAYRLVFAEADGLSGLVADCYADRMVVALDTAALLPWLDAILAELRAVCGATAVQVTCSADAAAREGLDPARLPGAGTAPDPVTIRENGHRFRVDTGSGQKTGFYLDQRVNRRRVAAYAAGRAALGCYCYTGAFEACLAAAGARSVLGIDSSEEALRLAAAHWRDNVPQADCTVLREDVPTALRRLCREGRRFGMVVLDPPKFVATAAARERGLRAYKDINLHALKLLDAGGVLATFSCSGLVSAEDLMTVLGWASQDAGRPVRVVETLGQPGDHPVAPAVRETQYLNGLVAIVA